MKLDYFNAIALLSLVGVVTITYLVRVAVKGRAHFDRVEKQGGSALLNKNLMEGGYWFFQLLGKGLVQLHVSPNFLSWMSLLFGALAGGVLAFGHFGFGAGFATVSAVLDALDGFVARELGIASDAGEVLDASVDRYVEFFFFAGLVVYYREMPFLMILTLAALVGSFMVSYSTAKAEALQIAPPKTAMRRPERAVYLTLGAVLSPITIPWFEQFRETPVAIGHPMVAALFMVAIMANIASVERLRAIAAAVRVREAEEVRRARLEASKNSESQHDLDNSTLRTRS